MQLEGLERAEMEGGWGYDPLTEHMREALQPIPNQSGEGKESNSVFKVADSVDCLLGSPIGATV